MRRKTEQEKLIKRAIEQKIKRSLAKDIKADSIPRMTWP